MKGWLGFFIGVNNFFSFGKGGEEMKTLLRGLMILGLMGIVGLAICGGRGEAKKEIIAQEGATGEVVFPASSIDKVVIGVLNFEVVTWGDTRPKEKKEALMKELKRNTRVTLVDIDESCSLSNLKRNGYERAQRYKNTHKLDMIIHVFLTGTPISPPEGNWRFYFSLIDLYEQKVKEVLIEINRIPIELGFRGIFNKLLASQDLNRVLTAKKEALEKKEVAVLREVKEGPKEIEEKKEVLGKKELMVPREVKESTEETQGFLIQNGPNLIAQGEYNRVLDLLRDVPERGRHAQIKTLACFANLKGWVSQREQVCKLNWWNLRQNLMHSRDKEATPMLVVFLKDKDPYLRLYAAELLGHIGDKRALKDLREAGENDENHKVRKYAKWAYEQISGEKF
jgi:hypothetical protein